ncbi:iron-containing alcohol dehydrogenase family protein [Bacillus litorisediminis]|uniref:iron-containing alcohol dehydrogenase family protein n=1 Tax=Bacillus litorisediminis TaxID=2922713 RepID=UPI001FAE4A33|nr:iron-containing alcohol dehydrogenase family protein [Bacillus litorisediminis]
MNLEVRGAPSYYSCEIGILDKLDTLLQSNHITKCIVLHGEKSWNAISPYFPKERTTLSFTFVPYHGECTLKEVNRVCKIAKQEKAEAIIGIGGGKVLDITKAAANQANIDAILLPTLASTCAAWTPLSVFYDEDGSFTHYSIFPRSSLYVLIEPRAFLNSPSRYLIAGIADTLAKWYEADVIMRELKDPPLAVSIAHHAARLCRDVLLEHSLDALQDLKAGEISPSLLKVIETNIVAGGMVGGYGDQFGRISGAHAVHNGLTILEETHHLLHGEKVAYGILIQLVLEKNWNEIKKLIELYKSLQLPYMLEHLGLQLHEQAKLLRIAEAIVKPSESIHLMKGSFSAEKLYQAFIDLETFVQKEISAVI